MLVLFHVNPFLCQIFLIFLIFFSEIGTSVSDRCFPIKCAFVFSFDMEMKEFTLDVATGTCGK